MNGIGTGAGAGSFGERRMFEVWVHLPSGLFAFQAISAALRFR
jgi:hypothetical protein